MRYDFIGLLPILNRHIFDVSVPKRSGVEDLFVARSLGEGQHLTWNFSGTPWA